MKFGKQIQSQQFTEWSPYYLDYKGLKKFISSLLNTPADSLKALGLPPIGIEEDRAKLLQSQKAAFFFKLERELEKINSFYLQKENELKVRLRTLIDKKKVLQSDTRRLKHASTLFKAIQEAFVQFEQELTKIQKYVELNNEGFRKILKKWDKRSKSSTKELYLSRQIDIQPCFNTQVLCELSDMASANRIELSNIQEGIPISPVSSTHNSHAAADSTQFANSGDEIDDIELELVKAVSSNQGSLVREILARIMQNPSPEDHGRLTRVFWHACSEAPKEITDMLIETQLVNFEYVDDIIERSCLHVAAMNGKLDLLEICTQHGANVEATDAYGRTALHYATMNGFTNCVSFLLTRQTDIECRDHDGFSPLIYAIMNGHTPCVEILIQAKANIEPRHEGDHIPLSLACHFGHTDIALMLYNQGAKNLPNAESLYPLHLAARQGHAELCRVLSQNKQDLDKPDKYNTWTPLFWAANDGHVDCVRILINAGCKVNAKDENGKTALYYAAWEGHMDCVQLLLDAGCEVEPVTEIMSASAPQSPPTTKATDEDDMELDVIPSLSLPPPIIPFRIYGHNYLDRKYQIQISLRQPPIRLYDNAQISSLRLIISSKPDTGMIPHSVILPLVDDRDVFNFQVDKLDDFLLEFDILATFGSKVLGRGVALPQSFSLVDFKIAEGHRTIPLLDGHLKVIGELSYDYSVINPFRGVQLEIGGRIETYWKSTNTVLPAPATNGIEVGSTEATVETSSTATATTTTTTTTATLTTTTISTAATTPTINTTIQPANANAATTTTTSSLSSTVPSFITASSLSGDYVQVVIQLTKDLVPVVFSNWLVPFQGLDLAVSDLTLKQFLRIGESILKDNQPHSPVNTDDVCPITGNSFIIQKLNNYKSFLSLEQVLEKLPLTMGLHLELKYPSPSDQSLYSFTNIAGRNTFVDTILQCIYDHVRSLSPDTASRSLFFSSYNPAICMVVNWKQPNYAVFFGTYCGLNMHRGAKRRSTDDEDNANQSAIVYKNDDVRCSSLKEAVKFAKQNNLLGVICGAQTIVQVPSLIKTAKESGLILVTAGKVNADVRYRHIQERYGVDAMMINQVVHFNMSMAGAGF